MLRNSKATISQQQQEQAGQLLALAMVASASILFPLHALLQLSFC